ncbi:uncharacterized protein LOC117782323 [Drosophila innubila]|uniref:uncharacterized protein LOC117782323 n=1 Tax=Drosophila innubila TaxID=198719 RepID=UPI00148CD8E0|nr:uncharacterized protein LOC117782323 [Drosophila innubila]
MRSTFSVICLLIIVLSSNGVYGYMTKGNFSNPAYPGKCVYNADTILNEGQAITLKLKCEKIFCGPGGWLTLLGCGAKSVSGGGCYIGERKYPDAEYPECCINVVHCTDPNDDSEM